MKNLILGVLLFSVSFATQAAERSFDVDYDSLWGTILDLTVLDYRLQLSDKENGRMVTQWKNGRQATISLSKSRPHFLKVQIATQDRRPATVEEHRILEGVEDTLVRQQIEALARTAHASTDWSDSMPVPVTPQ
jgi:hypothetical protein